MCQLQEGSNHLRLIDDETCLRTTTVSIYFCNGNGRQHVYSSIIKSFLDCSHLSASIKFECKKHVGQIKQLVTC